MTITNVFRFVSIYAIGYFKGYAIADTEFDPVYNMKYDDVIDLDKSYKNFIGLYFNIGYLPALVLIAPFCENYNRKCVIGFCTMGLGLALALISVIQN